MRGGREGGRGEANHKEKRKKIKGVNPPSPPPGSDSICASPVGKISVYGITSLPSFLYFSHFLKLGPKDEVGWGGLLF